MIVGVKGVVCTCGKDMERLGGVFGGKITTDTYYCSGCQKHVIVATPRAEKQEEFALEVKAQRR